MDASHPGTVVFLSKYIVLMGRVQPPRPSDVCCNLQVHRYLEYREPTAETPSPGQNNTEDQSIKRGRCVKSQRLIMPVQCGIISLSKIMLYCYPNEKDQNGNYSTMHLYCGLALCCCL